jgi:hypothetical protein
MRIHQTYEHLTFARARVIRSLAEGKTIRQTAEALGFTYDGARSQVRDIEGILGVRSIPDGARVLGQARGILARVLREVRRAGRGRVITASCRDHTGPARIPFAATRIGDMRWKPTLGGTVEP